jgi:hypothetical protein
MSLPPEIKVQLSTSRISSASFATRALTASYALGGEGFYTGTFAGNFDIQGTTASFASAAGVALVASSSLSSSTAQTAFSGTGSFTGSFKGDGSGLFGVIPSASVAQLAYALTGSATGTFKGDGTNITGIISSSHAVNTSVALQASSSISSSTAQLAYVLTGSATGTFKGDGSNITGIISSSYAVTSSFTNASLSSSYASFAPLSTSSSFANTATSASAAVNANNAFSAITASFASSSISSSFANTATSALTATSASYALTSSAAINAISSSYALTASFASNVSAGNSVTSSYALTAQTSLAGSGSYTGSFTGSFKGDGAQIINVVSSSYAVTSSFSLNSVGGLSQGQGDVRYVLRAGDSITGSFDISGSVSGSRFKGDGSNITGVISASYATNSGNSNTSTSASFATNAGTANIATSSSFATNAGTANIATSSSFATSAQRGVSNFTITGSLIISGGQVNQTVFNNSSSALTRTVDWSLSNLQKLILTGSCTFSFANPVSGGYYSLEVAQDTVGSRQIKWPTLVLWDGDGSIPSGTLQASSNDIYTFFYDGTNYFGSSWAAIGNPTASVATVAFSLTGSATGSFKGEFTGSATGSFKGDGSLITGVISSSYATNAGNSVLATSASVAQLAYALTGSATGTFKGDGSNITGVISSSYSTNASNAIQASSATSASVAQLAYALTGSATGTFKGDHTGSYTGSFKGDGSNMINITSASYSITSSFSLNAAGGGISQAAADSRYILRAGDIVTGSFAYTGSISASFFSGSGIAITDIITSSYAINAGSSNTSTSASFAASASAAILATSASVAQLAYTVTGSITGTLKGDGASVVNVISSSYSNNAGNSVLATSASIAQLAYTVTGSVTGTVSGTFKGDGTGITGIISASYATNAGNSNTSTSASFATSASAAIFATSASVAQLTFMLTGSATGTFKGDGASVINVITSSYAINTGNANVATTASFANAALRGVSNFSVTGSLIISGGQFSQTALSNGNSALSRTLDFSKSNIQKLTLTGSCTLSFSNPVSGAFYLVQVTQDSTGGRQLKWPSTVTWDSDGTAPSGALSANTTDLYSFYSDGGVFYGSSFGALGPTTSSLALFALGGSGSFTGSYTGSFKGDGANVLNVVTASYALTSSVALSNAGGGITQGQADARYVLRAGDSLTGSFDISGSVTGSRFKGDGSNITGVVSASYASNAGNSVLATSASVAQLAYALTGSATGTFKGDGALVTGVVSASYATNAGNSVLATSASVAQLAYALTGAHTGSVSVTGSALLTGSFTGSFKGDGANIINVVSASYAQTASFALFAISSGSGITQGQADARYILRTGDNVTGSYNVTGSFTASAFQGNGAGITGVVSASYASNAGNSVLATSASVAQLAYALTGSATGTFKGDGANVIGVVSASYAQTASFALFALSSGSGITQGQADARYILRTGDNVTGSYNITGSFTASAFQGNGAGITGVVSASYATNAGNSVLATSASVAQLAYAVTGSVTGTLRGDHTGSVSVTGSALLTGSFTGSFKGDGTNVLSVVTSSFSLTSSMATSLRANRSTLSFASPNLSASGLLGSVYTSSVQLGSETFVMIVSSSTISRVRLYYTTSSMITDISRSIGSDPSASSGVLLDTFFTGSTRILSLSPPVWVYNNDLTTNNTIYMTVTNHTASVVPISVQFTYIPI